nr:TonB-dependent receptor [uncultured Desulfobacter sp.]
MKPLNMSRVLGTIISVLLFTTATMAAAGQMDASTISWNIHTQSLKSALEIYQQVSGLNLAYSDNLVKGKTTQGAQGNHTRGQALEKVLDGTDLTYVVTSKGTVILKVKNSKAAQEENLPAYETAGNKTKKSESQQISLEMQTVTVTANKIEEDLQRVPQSITVIDDEVLKEKGIEDIPDVINEIPNMAFKSAVDDNVNFRGLNTSLFTWNNPVVIYIDGIPYTNTYGFNASLANVERIEVLRGPQGTLYGKDAIGAVIKVVTKEPENEWHGNIDTEYGSYNNIEGSFNVNGSLIEDKLYLGLNGRYQQDDGWITNDYTDDDKANKGESKNLAAFLLYKPNYRFTAKATLSNDSSKDYWLSGYILPSGTDISEYSRDEAEHVSFDEDTVKEVNSLAQSLHLKYEFDSATLSSVTTHRDLDFDGVWDRDKMADTDKDGFFAFNTYKTETWTEELRLSSNNKEGLRWVAGVYFDIEDIDEGPYGIYEASTDYEWEWISETKSKTQALFGQIMIPFLDNFELTLGGRYQRIEKEMDLDAYYNLARSSSDPIYSLNADKTWTTFLPKAALSYRLNDNWNTYASVARGYMPGGFNYSSSTGSEEDNAFDPQQLTSYEIGIKGAFDRVRLAAAVFYMDIEDTHIYYQGEDGFWRTSNADSSHSQGVELDLTYFLTDSIELTAALGIIDAEQHDGKPIEDTPSHTARIGAAYLHPNGFYARGDVTNLGEVPYDTDDNEKYLDSYTVVDVKVGYRFKGYDIYAYCNNLTDEEYITAYGAVVYYGDPRTFGIGVRYSF